MRYTVADVDRKIELVKSVAKRAGVVYVNYSRATFDTLKRESMNGTHWIAASPEGTTGSSDLSIARGVRECVMFLDGLSTALDAVARHNEQSKSLAYRIETSDGDRLLATVCDLGTAIEAAATFSATARLMYHDVNIWRDGEIIHTLYNGKVV